MVLFAVLVLVGSAVLVATAVVFIVSGEVAGGANEREVLRMRAAGLSAVEAIAARLGSQRNVMLDGGAPSIEATLELWETGGETATARLLPVDSRGATLVAEPSKMPLALASIESLVASGVVNEGLAGRAIGLRDAGPKLLSIDALLRPRGGADGLTAGELFGPLDLLGSSVIADPRAARDRALAARVAQDSGSPARSEGSAPLREILTTFAFEPQLRADGAGRVRLDVEWTDDHRGAVDALLGGGSAALLEAAMKGGDASLTALFASWRSRHQAPREWHAFLDGVALGDGPALDRVDIMRAPLEVLRMLPGVSREVAERIVREREGISGESRRSIAWLAERELLNADGVAALVERTTTRSFLWRVRVEATLARSGGEAIRPGVIFEAVIDCSEERPRIALLRDLSTIDTVASMVAAMPQRSLEESFDVDAAEEASVPAATPEEGDGEVMAPALEVDVEAGSAASTSESSEGSQGGAQQTPARHGIGRWRRTQ